MNIFYDHYQNISTISRYNTNGQTSFHYHENSFSLSRHPPSVYIFGEILQLQERETSLYFSTPSFSAIVQRLENAQQVSPKAFKRSEEVRYFILISTIMTWANTKPLNPDEPDLPFTEEDYRKRRPHPNFKNHIQCEKDVVVTRKKIKLKDKLKTLVICCGVTYGDEQGPLHHLFKMAWLNASFLPIFGRGNNRIPLLHVRDMTK